MRTSVFMIITAFMVLVPGAVRGQSTADSAAIRQAALDYIEGWYAGDSARMARAVHPRLVKRIIASSPGSPSAIREMTAAELIGATRTGGGRRTPATQRRSDVRILDIFGGTASVRVDAHDWVDYMQIARIDGQWRILNVLWEMRPAR